MGANLKLSPDGTVLTVKVFGDDFTETLTKVKSLPGRRYNPDAKLWELEATPDNALRCMALLEPTASVEVQNLVRNHQLDVEESLISRIGEDGELEHPELRAALFPYQRAFVAWALEHRHCILADEMGVGKTIQAYAAWREWQLKQYSTWSTEKPHPYDRPLLVVCPNGQRKSWRDEIVLGPRDRDGNRLYDEWPTATVQILNGQNIGKRRAQLETTADVYITNWEKLRSDSKVLAKRRWGCIIADEAHRAKNRNAKQTKGLWDLTAPLQLALTGTPIMNSPGELWSILRWLNPEQYARHIAGGGYWVFHNSYVDDYETKHGRVMRGIKNVDGLRFELADKLVRRTKKQVLPDLPDKLPPKVIEVELMPTERNLYAEVETALFMDIGKFALEKATAEYGSNTPLDNLKEYAADYVDGLADMPLDKLQGLIPNGAARIVRLRQITAMAKAREALEIVGDNPTKPFVIFTWYVPPAQWLAEKLEATKLRTALIAGAGGEEPSQIAKRFQAGDYDQCVATIAKGGTGLDLYRSNHAIFADEDWVPAVNQQALDRLHRQGQEKEVSSTILRVPGTVDTGKVAPANRFKDSIVKQVFGG